MFYRDCFSSPIGDIALLAYQDTLIEISLLGYRGLSREAKNSKGRFVNEIRELSEYFFEGRKKFNIT